MSKNILILTEMPEMLTNLGVGIANRQINKETASFMLANPLRYDLEQDDDTLLFRVGSEKHYKMALYNKAEKTIDYFVEAEIHPQIDNEYVTQILVWRRSDSLFVDGITKKIFFRYLLKDHNCIMSDEMQTREGKEFWIRMMALAVRNKMRVGLADLKTNHITWKPEDSIYGDWLQANNGWLDTERGQDLRYVIHGR